MDFASDIRLASLYAWRVLGKGDLSTAPHLIILLFPHPAVHARTTLVSFSGIAYTRVLNIQAGRAVMRNDQGRDDILTYVE